MFGFNVSTIAPLSPPGTLTMFARKMRAFCSLCGQSRAGVAQRVNTAFLLLKPSRALLSKHKTSLAEALGPQQFAVGTAAGTELLGHSARALTPGQRVTESPSADPGQKVTFRQSADSAKKVTPRPSDDPRPESNTPPER